MQQRRLANTIKYIDTNDKIIEGLRIPSSLDSVNAVNFVLTQEPGKLKPKDLKIAIERNRAEREHRAEEQRKLREEGGGAGILDLRGILAEEKLNAKEGDAFQRQLREMAFLADVDEVEKQENEKAFRISEDYLGSHLMNEDDISFVYKQREMTRIVQLKHHWRTRQARQVNTRYIPVHSTVKAGTQRKTAISLIQSLLPQYDPNKNDIWSKRLNTLRRFISLVSKWIIRRRVSRRMKKVMLNFHEHSAFSRSEIRVFIDQENSDHRGMTITEHKEEKNSSKNITSSDDKKSTLTVAEMIFSQPNPVLTKRLRNEMILQQERIRIKQGEAEISSNMAKRNLFPIFDRNILTGGDNSSRDLISTANCLLTPPVFDDRSFFHQKIRPEFVLRGYNPHTIPLIPIDLPPAASDKHPRRGAPEEQSVRSAADVQITVLQRSKFYTVHSSESVDIIDSMLIEVDTDTPPAWLSASAAVNWASNEIDFFTTLPQYRKFQVPLPRCEMDVGWELRPHAPPIPLERDQSVRNQWLDRQAGFIACNYYLLGSAESRWRDGHIPPMGPTLTDYYQPDHDRHVSGLNCFARDHLRAVHEWDMDITPLQTALDPGDKLTDSESDNDEDYSDLKPSLAKVRALLRPPKKVVEEVSTGKAGAKPPAGKATPAAATKEAPKTVEAPPASSVLVDDDNESFALLGENERKEEQVELLRDRKTLDLESTWWKKRKSTLDEVTKRQLQVSSASTSVFQAMRVQLPFHVFEDEVYKEIGTEMKELSNIFVEADPTKQMQNSMTSTSLLPSAMSSPVKR